MIMVLCLALCACGGSSSGTSLPKTDEDERYSMTLNDAKITRTIDHSDDGDNFFIPTDSDLSTSTKDVLFAGEDKTMLYFEAEYSYIGKEPYETTDFIFLKAFEPELSIGDYNFSSDFFVFHRINNGDWNICASDAGSDIREALGLDLSVPGGNKGNGSLFEYQPLEENVYTLRGVIAFPEKIADECAKGCTLKLAGTFGGVSFTFTPN